MNVTNVLNIDWDKVDPEFNFATMDEGGSVWVFRERPVLNDIYGYWCGSSTLDIGFRYTRDGKSILKEPVKWKDTLTERPVKVKVE